MEDKSKATEIIFDSVYALSMDMIKLVHATVANSSHMECDFASLAKHLQDINNNFRDFVLDKKWMSKAGNAEVKKKIIQIHELTDLCLAYESKLKAMSESIIKITETIEKNKKMRDVAQNMVRELERQQNNEDDSEPQEDEEDES